MGDDNQLLPERPRLPHGELPAVLLPLALFPEDLLPVDFDSEPLLLWRPAEFLSPERGLD